MKNVILIEIWAFTRLLCLILFMSEAPIEFSVQWFCIYLHDRLTLKVVVSIISHCCRQKIRYTTFLSSTFTLHRSSKFKNFIINYINFFWKNTLYIMVLSLILFNRFKLNKKYLHWKFYQYSNLSVGCLIWNVGILEKIKFVITKENCW